jgi:hypothetical protein
MSWAHWYPSAVSLLKLVDDVRRLVRAADTGDEFMDSLKAAMRAVLILRLSLVLAWLSCERGLT